MLDRCRATETCPKIVETFGSSEFYNLRASPDLVGTRADRDIPLPANVRRYYFPGVSHGGGPGGLGTLVALRTTAQNAGGTIKLTNLTKRVGDLLQVTKLLTIFEVFDDEEVAAQSFKKDAA